MEKTESRPVTSGKSNNLGSAKPTMTENLCKLLWRQAAPEVDVEILGSGPLNFKYFVSVFKEVVETKLDSHQQKFKQKWI